MITNNSYLRNMYGCQLIYKIMSTYMRKCVITGLDFDDSLAYAHYNTHTSTTITARPTLNGRLLTDARYCMLQSKQTQLATVATAPAIVLNTTALQTAGMSQSGISTAKNGFMGGGSTMSPEAVDGLLEHFEKELNFEFDRNSFLLSMAYWYAVSTGSTNAASVGSIKVYPDGHRGNTTPEKLVQMSILTDAASAYGASIGMSQLTLRAFIHAPGIALQVIRMYQSHPSFESMRSQGIPFAINAGISPSEFWLALPIVSYVDLKLTESQRTAIVRRQGDTQASDTTGSVFSIKYDPNYTSVNPHRQQGQISGNSPTSIATRIALQQAANSLKPNP